ncbi:hypothetical protein V6D72_004906 [Salmonella enterica]|nr:hypothetical protein [Salmonella enterica]ECY3797568.1 hypothetical protein [Salmonella enterica subsp. enterica serovar Minnesota]EDL3544281.1 hypothetical protein [Salmonella enterica subsp. enterica serovar Newport]EGR8151047.1 hypothetical protein [Salmonella enterica subsp. enterica serovar Adelaide]EAW8000718.1 hypothetical protein [Salmonella enterica]
MKMKMKGCGAAIAVLLSCSAGYAFAGDFTGSPVMAEASVSISSPLSFTHTLSASSFSAGKLAADTVFARGEVALSGGGNISQVNLSWNRNVNPTMLIAQKEDEAVMTSTASDGSQHSIFVHFVPETQATSADGDIGKIYRLSTPGSKFDYTVKLLGDAAEAYAGNYKLSVRADVAAA